MNSRRWVGAPWRLRSLLKMFLLGGTFLSLQASAKDEPIVSKTSFDSLPVAPIYFANSETLLIQDREEGSILRSTDAGSTWREVEEIPKGAGVSMIQHTYDNQRAYLLSPGLNHWYTKNQGDTWHEFRTPYPPSNFRLPLSFHAEDGDKVLFHSMECLSLFNCEEKTYVTTNGFDTNPDELRRETHGCSFAKSSEMFDTNSRKANDNRILCVAAGRYSSFQKDNRLLISDDYFETEEEPDLESGRTVSGVVNMATVKNYLVVAVRAEGTDEMALYVTTDTDTWHRAEFPHDHRLEEDAYTILESTNYSIQVDVMTTRRSQPMGVLFVSNSNGTYFTRLIEHTNRNEHGLVDFEKIKGIQGIVLVNVVKNWKDVETSILAEKQVVSQISFDDGRTFQSIKSGNKDLHLHSVTHLHNSGRVFSSPAPGLVMGIGNTGAELLEYDEGDLYTSRDAGLTWHKALDGAHKYEFGDQGSVLVAVYDEEPTDKVMYSINHGADWESVDLGVKIKARLLTTASDSSILKFLLIGSSGVGSNMKHYVFNIDFNGLNLRECNENDFEKWYARLDEDGNPDCLMGHKQWYQRRKADAECFIGDKFEEPLSKFEICKCTEEDFECDYDYVKNDDGECEPAGPSVVPDGACKNREDTYLGGSGYRLIPENQCQGGIDKSERVERECKDVIKPPATGKIEATISTFDASHFREKYYFERTESGSGDDETVIMRMDNGEIHMTKDHGKHWEEILARENVIWINPHQYLNDVVYFITSSKTVFYSLDRGKNIKKFTAPDEPNKQSLQLLSFHPKYKDWMIWTGARDCKSGSDCHSVAHCTTDRGDSWNMLKRYVRNCQFIAEEGHGRSEKLVYCEQYQNENQDNPLQLLSSDDFFVEHTSTPFDDIIRFATMSEFIIVAVKDEEHQSLKVDTSIDGETFADALFPPNFRVPHQQAYTVLDSSTHSIFLHVTVSTLDEHEFGSIIKSNSNGTSYVLSLDAVNRNMEGYVDFEKMQGLEGVALVNVVDNHEEAAKGQTKTLKTMITHNDGAEWTYLNPPKADADHKPFDCNGPIEKCSLHLHGYTERDDPQDTYSSASAVGLMMGVGNVGEHLGRLGDGDTFLTRDGGFEWVPVKKGAYMWEYGDQGSIIVIVEKDVPTKVVYYTLDEGRTWDEYPFSTSDMQIEDITTEPSDMSLNFLLWGRQLGRGNKIATVNLNFEGLFEEQCKLDEDDPEKGDYYLWEPKHPTQEENCLFGHVAQYHRKKPEAHCYNGRKALQHVHSISRNCSCTRRDFECDFNYERKSDGSCGLVEGLSPADHSAICQIDPSAVEWYDVTGYRRIPLTTCEGGQELEFTSRSHPCPGHEEEYREKRKIGGFALFAAIFFPIAAAAGVGYWVWRNWDGKFGRIRLGDAPGAQSWDGVVSVFVVVVAGVWTVVSMVPDIVGRVWSWARGGRRYTTRGSFQRDRGDYDRLARQADDEASFVGMGDEDEDI